MRALIQRAESASVSADGRPAGRIGAGLLVLLGVGEGDGPEGVERLARKTVGLRVFEGPDGRMSEPLGAREILCVSQFTLYADTQRGNRPSFSAAAAPALAEPLYEAYCDAVGAERGVFGALMRVELIADGPVTVMLEA